MAAQRRKQRAGDSSEDTFVAGILRLVGWAQKHIRALILAVVALIIVVGGVIYYVDYRTRVTEVASSEIRALRAQLRSEGAGEAVIQGLRSFIAQFGDTPYGMEARVLLAEELLRQGRATEALNPATTAAEGIGGDPLATRAAFLVAAAHEELGDTAAAIDVYERIGRQARLDGEKIRGLEGAARLYTAAGDLQRAIAVYDRLLELVPEDDPQHAFYVQRRAELRARRDRWTLSNGTT